MKLRFFLVSVLLSLSTSFSLAQVAIPADSSTPSDLSPGNQPQVNASQVWLMGKVAVEGGSAPPDSVKIVLRCGDTERAQAFSSRNGEFSLMFTPGDSGPDEGAASRESSKTISTHPPSFANGNGCELDADSPDYVSKSLPLPLVGEIAGDINQVGTIVLYPRTAAQGTTVSATSLAAPDQAKKAFEKGQEQERKGKFQAACDFFRRAVQVYPQYAIAWLELGRTQIKQNDLNSAQQSFHEATSQDAQLVGGYEGLAEVALREQKWKDLAYSTRKILDITPETDAKIWFLNSAANFNLGDLNRAEAGVVRGIHLDSAHHVPQLEYLYGVILAQRASYGPAIQHLQAFLQMSPSPEESKRAASTLQSVQKLAASANSAAPAGKP